MGTLKRLGVFDSGLGGLTVLNEICKYNTGLDVVYVGDTARVPYGSRTVETITRYAEQDVRFLLSQGVEAILIACGTVSTNCLPALTKSFSLPIVGVIDAGCQAALRSSRTKRIGVIGTRATINSRAYEHRIRELCPDAQTWGVECPLFVPLIENGFAPDDPITELTVDRYLSQFKGAGVDTIIMGCTHYPFLAKTLQKHMPDVSFINVGKALSYGLKEQFDLPRTQTPNRVSYFVSDEDTGFLDIARRYLDAVQADNVQKVNIDQF
jgi:glutamate racemase